MNPRKEAGCERSGDEDGEDCENRSEGSLGPNADPGDRSTAPLSSLRLSRSRAWARAGALEADCSSGSSSSSSWGSATGACFGVMATDEVLEGSLFARAPAALGLFGWKRGLFFAGGSEGQVRCEDESAQRVKQIYTYRCALLST